MKTFFLLLSCFLVSCLATINAGAANLFITSGNPKAPPVMWEQDNTLVGVAPDLAGQILKDLGLAYEIRVEGDWQQVQDKCREGKVDMIVAAFTNAERKTYMDFSIPYLPEPTVIVVQQGEEFPYRGWDSLIGKKGVTNVGESYGEAFDRFIKEKLDVSYVAFERAVQLLNRGEADYLIVDLYTALIYTRLLQGEDAITIIDPPVATQSFHIGVAKNSPLAAKLPEINKELYAKVKDGTVEKLFYAHFANWKKLIAKRSSFYNKEANIRQQEHQDYLQAQDVYEQERLSRLLFENRESLPAAIE